jgi:hypothetical protein
MKDFWRVICYYEKSQPRWEAKALRPVQLFNADSPIFKPHFALNNVNTTEIDVLQPDQVKAIHLGGVPGSA